MNLIHQCEPAAIDWSNASCQLSYYHWWENTTSVCVYLDQSHCYHWFRNMNIWLLFVIMCCYLLLLCYCNCYFILLFVIVICCYSLFVSLCVNHSAPLICMFDISVFVSVSLWASITMRQLIDVLIFVAIC